MLLFQLLKVAGALNFCKQSSPVTLSNQSSVIRSHLRNEHYAKKINPQYWIMTNIAIMRNILKNEYYQKHMSFSMFLNIDNTFSMLGWTKYVLSNNICWHQYVPQYVEEHSIWKTYWTTKIQNKQHVFFNHDLQYLRSHFNIEEYIEEYIEEHIEENNICSSICSSIFQYWRTYRGTYWEK